MSDEQVVFHTWKRGQCCPCSEAKGHRARPTGGTSLPYIDQTNRDLPPAQGLYHPRNEHDACGLNFVCDMHGRKSHEIVAKAIGSDSDEAVESTDRHHRRWVERDLLLGFTQRRAPKVGVGVVAAATRKGNLMGVVAHRR